MIEVCAIRGREGENTKALIEGEYDESNITISRSENRNPLRIGQITFTVLAILAFAVGTIILSLVWFGVSVTTTGKDVYADAELRGFVFIVIWPATMLAVWMFS